MTALWLGRWQDVLADVECDALICDPPYGARTHAGHDALSDTTIAVTGQRTIRQLGYSAWTVEDMRTFAAHWGPRTRGWYVHMTSHEMLPTLEDELRAQGRYVFTPLPFINKRPRLSGDGPACWACWILVARPRTREFSTWGCLPGAYVLPLGQTDGDEERIVGGKHLWLMRALVRDYSRPGDLICDPCAGGGTTLLAAAIEGRRAVGSEMDPDTHALATRRLARGYTPNMFAEDGL